jgi:hypothetical protein
MVDGIGDDADQRRAAIDAGHRGRRGVRMHAGDFAHAGSRAVTTRLAPAG